MLFILAVSAFLISISAKMPHPFYVSVTEIKFNKNNTAAISCRLFTDDLQNALFKLYKVKTSLNKKDTALNAFLEKYFKERLVINTANKNLTLHCIGYEIEEEATWCYFEANGANSNKISISNSLLYDFLPEQSNLIHCYVNNERKSFKLVNPQTQAVFEFN
ncbi:MAG: DUF6702 family protein [Bacteroidota bacterium]